MFILWEFFTCMGSEGSGGPSTKFMHIFLSKMRSTKFSPGTKLLCMCTNLTGMMSGVLPAVCMIRQKQKKCFVTVVRENKCLGGGNIFFFRNL